MKKICLVLAVAFSSICASAQFVATSNINEPSENESWGFSNFTEDLGLGYQISESFIVGLQRNGEEYDLFGRYNLNDNMYLSAQMPTENSTDNLRVGIGYSTRLVGEFYVEPNYSIDWNTEEDGEFKIGIAYRF